MMIHNKGQFFRSCVSQHILHEKWKKNQTRIDRLIKYFTFFNKYSTVFATIG